MESPPWDSDFEKMMRVNGPRIYTLAIRLTGNDVEGQDLAQETFVKAFEQWSRFRGESQASSWLYRICLNLWKNRVRYEKRRFFRFHFSLHHSDPDGDRPDFDIAAPDAPIDASLQQGDQQELVKQALERLDAPDRAILILRDMEDRPYEEIAQMLDIPLGTVKSRLARSRERLRQLLEPQVRETQ